MSAGRVLVVDDEPGLRDLLRDYLEAHVLQMATAADGRAFRAGMARRPPEVVLLDPRLGAEGGHDLAREIARDGRTGVLMLTAAGELDVRLRGLAAEADDYMANPFEPREIGARLRSVLRRVREAPSPAAAGRPGCGQARAGAGPQPTSPWSPTTTAAPRRGSSWRCGWPRKPASTCCVRSRRWRASAPWCSGRRTVAPPGPTASSAPTTSP